MSTSEHELQKTTVEESAPIWYYGTASVVTEMGRHLVGFCCCICVLYDTFLHSDSAPWCIRYDSMPCVHNVSWWKHLEALVILQHTVMVEVQHRIDS